MFTWERHRIAQSREDNAWCRKSAACVTWKDWELVYPKMAAEDRRQQSDGVTMWCLKNINILSSYLDNELRYVLTEWNSYIKPRLDTIWRALIHSWLISMSWQSAWVVRSWEPGESRKRMRAVYTAVATWRLLVSDQCKTTFFTCATRKYQYHYFSIVFYMSVSVTWEESSCLFNTCTDTYVQDF